MVPASGWVFFTQNPSILSVVLLVLVITQNVGDSLYFRHGIAQWILTKRSDLEAYSQGPFTSLSRSPLKSATKHTAK